MKMKKKKAMRHQSGAGTAPMPMPPDQLRREVGWQALLLAGLQVLAGLLQVAAHWKN